MASARDTSTIDNHTSTIDNEASVATAGADIHEAFQQCVSELLAADRLQNLDQQGGQQPFRRDRPRPVVPQIASDCGGRLRSAMPMIVRMARSG